MIVMKKNANIQLKTEIIQIYKLWKIGKEEEAQMINKVAQSGHTDSQRVQSS